MAKPKPKPIKLPKSAIQGYGSMAAPPPAPPHPATLQEIADAFGGADKAKAYTDALAAGPPPGSYDPQLDVQGKNDENNFIWGAQDQATAFRRGESDYATQTTQRDEAWQNALSDLFKTGGREKQDYDTATGNLNTQYQRQGVSQTQSANAAGVGGGGALVAAAAARAGNQAHDQSGLDTTWARQQQDVQEGIDRQNQAYTADRVSAPGLTGSDAEGGLMGLQHRRSTGDLYQQGARAADTFYDVLQPGLKQAKVTSAVQSGNWLTDPTQAPEKPYSEYTKYSGTHKGIVYHRYPDGTVKPVRKVGY